VSRRIVIEKTRIWCQLPLHKIFDDLRNRLEISHKDQNPKNKVVAVGECGFDETSMAPIEHQIFVL
jgi:Tat protein secretion system quality control protein TatD with DNase activity